MVSKKVSAKSPKNAPSKQDLSGMSWDELRQLAKSCGVPAKGKRPELESAVRKQLSSQTPAAGASKSKKKTPTSGTAKKALTAKKAARKKAATKAATSVPTLRGLGDDSSVFKVGQRVEVKSNGIRGKVVEVTESIAVALESGLTESFAAAQLKKLPPLL